MNGIDKAAKAAQSLDATSLSALETTLADKLEELEDAKRILGELRAGGDVRAVLEAWITRAIDDGERTLRELQQYLVRVKTDLKARDAGLQEYLNGGGE